MKINRSLLSGGIAMLIWLLAACSKEATPPAGSTLVITRSGSTVFPIIGVKITSDNSFKTDKGVAPTFSEDTVHYIMLTNEQHSLLKDMLSTFPLGKLRATGKDVFGCRGCLDAGVYIFHYKGPDGKTETWEVENFRPPDFIKDYLEQLTRKLRAAGL